MKQVKSEIPGLSREQTQKIIDLLATSGVQNKVHSLILFGSRAKGNYRPGSDIDLCIDGLNLTYDDLTALKLKYDQLYFPWTLDLVAKNLVQEPALLEHIDRVGIVLAEFK